MRYNYGMDEKKKIGVAKFAGASVPVTILGLIWNTMNTLTNSVQELNSSLAVIASQVSRHSTDITYQRDQLERARGDMDKVKDALRDIQAYVKEKSSPN